MIRSYLDNSSQPRAPISVLDKHAHGSLLGAVVDTGFIGDLCISIHEITKINWTFSHNGKFELGNGAVVTQPVYWGRIVFDKRPMTVKVVVSSSVDTLIGAGLLSDKKLAIDYPGKSVLIKTSKPRKKK